MDRPPDDPRSVAELIAAALQSDEDVAWSAIAALHWRGGSDAFDQASSLCVDTDPLTRARGAAILAQLGLPDPSFPEDAFTVVSPLLADVDDRVVSSAIYALGHIDKERAVSEVLRFRTHLDPEIRHAVAFTLGGLDHEDAFEALLALAKDADEDVREWATFALAQGPADKPPIRDALADRLTDENSNVGLEAVYGLGRRGDARAIPYLKVLLHEDPDNFFAREAAALLVGHLPNAQLSTSELLGALQSRQRWARRK